MDLFRKWFKECFVPEVKMKMRDLDLPPKALLILDNAPGHPDVEELSTEDKNIQAMFLPPNCTPLIQPMDQHVIQKVKLHYRKSLLMSILSNDARDIPSFLKSFDLLTAIFSLRQAWLSVPSGLIQASWKKLWPQLNELLNTDDEEDMPLARLRQKLLEEKQKTNETLQEMTKVCNEIFETEVTTDDIAKWIDGDNEDFQITDEEILSAVIEDKTDDEEEVPVEKTISHKEALKSFEICMQWSMENNVSDHQLLLLRQIRDQAAAAHFASLKQRRIDSFFKI